MYLRQLLVHYHYALYPLFKKNRYRYNTTYQPDQSIESIAFELFLNASNERYQQI